MGFCWSGKTIVTEQKKKRKKGKIKHAALRFLAVTTVKTCSSSGESLEATLSAQMWCKAIDGHADDREGGARRADSSPRTVRQVHSYAEASLNRHASKGWGLDQALVSFYPSLWPPTAPSLYPSSPAVRKAPKHSSSNQFTLVKTESKDNKQL